MSDQATGELKEAVGILVKFARHRDGCGCFICRNLTDHEREVLGKIRSEYVR